ncbi:WxL domain-containing protein [Vagococcus hydrophili]|uniref:WxL domain-containing protein n=1 Tax=Vagococcus hydrophili TaxID=2714947 RepID=A0A6G8AT32_9ENTE|nr:WxL domain-containing protein [Vagococcus hydrophili]QIL48224.1 hypothetical protein G7082_06840 [Vagococcus hydrophili]
MKLSTKSAAALIALLAASTVGGVYVSADEASEAAEAEAAKTIKSDGRVEIGNAKDTGDDLKKTLDPETSGYLVQPGKTNGLDQMVVNTKKGPMKIERVPNFDFGKIEPQANDVFQYAKDYDYKKNVAAKDQPEDLKDVKRGAIIQFADVRNDQFGYTVKASMSEQFKNAENKMLAGSTILLNHGIMKAEDTNENKVPTTFKTGDLKLVEGTDGLNGAAVEVVTAAATEGKGRFVVEYGQSGTFDKTDKFAGIGADEKDSADKSVQLMIPNKTASNMAKGNYTAKITWTIGATE